ncbi:hypothetical protein BY458DRAFT_511135 [Sporodiniella umbellata]|nr:hypothetical protein BY458DRAFT_511135 [Sporodiniella umbellata]
MPPPPKDYWFHLKYWGIIIPVAFTASFIYKNTNTIGVFREVADFNTGTCQKLTDPRGLNHCEDIILSNEPGVSYLSCNPAIAFYNPVVGINRLNPDQPIENGAIWKLTYDQTPPLVKKFDSGSIRDFHPLGIAHDVNPATDEKTILSVNLRHDGPPSVEIFNIEGEKFVHKRTIKDPKLYNPNAIHLVQDKQFRAEDGTPSFFFSNDHYFANYILKNIENLLLPWSYVGFYNARTGRVEKAVNGLSFANGVAGTDDTLFVSETSAGVVRQYKINKIFDEGTPSVSLDYVNQVRVGGAPDNLHYQADKELLVIAVHPRTFDFYKRVVSDPNTAPKAPSQIEVWDLSAGETRTILQNDGSLLSTSSSGVFDTKTSKLLVTGVYGDGVIVCDL